MKKLNITTGGYFTQNSSTERERIEIVTRSKTDKNQVDMICILPDNLYQSESQSFKEQSGNSELIIDAFKVASECDLTPSMLLAENKRLNETLNEFNRSLVQVIKIDYTLSELISQRETFLDLLEIAREKLIGHNLDPLTGELDEDSRNSKFIKLLGTLIQK
ncbi:MAG: hypothetical protein ACJASM_002049 [Salibacteraceae bacterium]|jgi:hypothetical protein